MSKVIAYKNPDGSVSVVHPTGELSFEEVLKKDVPYGAEYSILEADELPTFRDFRAAWKLGGTGKIDHDMAKAKEIKKDKLRELRKPLLEALDLEYQKADEQGDNAKKRDVAAKKQALRDVTKSPELDVPVSPEQLRDLVPAVLKDQVAK